jgi:hypothetical protein
LHQSLLLRAGQTQVQLLLLLLRPLRLLLLQGRLPVQ